MRDTKKKRLKFIVNPFAGIGNKKNFRKQLKKHLDHTLFEYQVEYTTSPGHGAAIAHQSIKDDFDIIIAVGGDGSVNEIASAMVGTNKILGIIPAGSGNGLATYFGYSRNIRKAINSLNKATVVKVDTGMLNDRPFFNVAGLGFDAWVAYKTKKSTFRGFFGYMLTAIRETFAYRLKNYTIKLDDQVIQRKCLCIEVANATMFGYNMKIAPLAKADDGLLDVVIIKNAPKLRYFLSIFRFPFGSIHKSRLVEYYSAKAVEIIPHEECAAHIDGEGFMVKDNLYFSLKNLSLLVLKPL